MCRVDFCVSMCVLVHAFVCRGVPLYDVHAACLSACANTDFFEMDCSRADLVNSLYFSLRSVVFHAFFRQPLFVITRRASSFGVRSRAGGMLL